ncbi:hypothetical protein AVEN_122854-1 [Araneus ventricosus]|uniref:Uncharacterized protein n=1 Tax=Araneus ventricosus TaxID=182803 RepID=A0A4Y2R7R2_ARAVE|nr:hypothetical protein AVEN_122854-1 [Araneus ventricosus]
MLAHGSAAWCLNPTSRMVRKLSSIQRGFLLAISGAYKTTPTAALQVILSIIPLHLQFQLENLTYPVEERRNHFFIDHGPFGAYLKRINLVSSLYCSGGGVGSNFHYATETTYKITFRKYLVPNGRILPALQEYNLQYYQIHSQRSALYSRLRLLQAILVNFNSSPSTPHLFAHSVHIGFKLMNQRMFAEVFFSHRSVKCFKPPRNFNSSPK